MNIKEIIILVIIATVATTFFGLFIYLTINNIRFFQKTKLLSTGRKGIHFRFFKRTPLSKNERNEAFNVAENSIKIFMVLLPIGAVVATIVAILLKK